MHGSLSIFSFRGVDMRKSALRIVCFISILTMVLFYTNKVFKIKYGDGIYDLTKFYELEDETVDVLFLGSSHAFEDFNTGTLWNEYGMASYILGGSMQPMWNTYFYLKEALKTQKPELIVLEGFCTTYESEFIDDSRIIKNNYGLRWSRDKINSIQISAPEERWNEFLLEYVQYHTRYSELGAADFLKNQGNRQYDDWKGLGCNMTTKPLTCVDVSGITQSMPLYEKTEEYYRKTLDLAQEKGIPIVVVISPYAGITEEQQQKLNSADNIAVEYDVPFVNCNLITDEIGIDYSTDAADGDHLNYKGNQKYSSYMGAYLKAHFEISDHRGDHQYDTWQRNADYLEQAIADQILRETYDINIICEQIQNLNYRLILSVDGYCSTADENLSSFFEKIGIERNGLCGIWVKENNVIIDNVWYSGMESATKYINDPLHDFCMKRSVNDSGQYDNIIIVDNEQYHKVNNGVNVLVFDKKTETVADMFGIDMDAGYSIVK